MANLNMKNTTTATVVISLVLTSAATAIGVDLWESLKGAITNSAMAADEIPKAKKKLTELEQKVVEEAAKRVVQDEKLKFIKEGQTQITNQQQRLEEKLDRVLEIMAERRER